MKESYRKGVATILTPSHARAVARLRLKRWTGAYVGWVLSSENGKSGSRRCQPCWKATERCAQARACRFLRSRNALSSSSAKTHARIETPCARTESRFHSSTKRPRGYPWPKGGGPGGESEER